tara:strand:+ start:316 stop:495 length:180 start_codon:yes stop_codon:yes gene_type:complete
MNPRTRAELARERADDKYIDGSMTDAQYRAELARIDSWLIDVEYNARRFYAVPREEPRA